MIQLTGRQKKTGCHGWILYTEFESARNRCYIELYEKACRKYGMSIELGIFKPPRKWGVEEKQRLVELTAKECPAFVVNRTRDYLLAKAFEELGVRVYNNSQVAELGNDKAKAYRYMQKRGIAVMPTVYGVEEPPKQYPAVVKSCGGHGGTQVYLLKDISQWMEWKRSVCQPDVRYLVQQAASDAGRDVRVYIVGNRIVAALLREAEDDFRSNLCLGGKAGLYELSSAQRGLVERAVSQLTIGMAGIDFIFHHGEFVFNEIEDMAGARGLYSLTDYDIADEYVKYIQEDLRHG